MTAPALNIVYLEPEEDRWLPFDRYPRRMIRNLVRSERPSGHKKVFWNLAKGLEKAGVPHRVNDLRHIARHPGEPVCLLGKPFVLDAHRWKNPTMLGPCIFSHPCDMPDLFERHPVERILVPCEWNRAMWAEHYGDRVTAWPVGIDTEEWQPGEGSAKVTDVLLYDKVRWERERFEGELIQPIRDELTKRGLSFRELRYGAYEEAEFRQLVKTCRAMVVLCEHETQGIAIQEAMAAGLPVFAWDRRGYWRDPNYHPEKVRFEPVTTVPYWDGRCGETFADFEEFRAGIGAFAEKSRAGAFDPRAFVLETLTLEKCALEFVRIHESVFGAVR